MQARWFAGAAAVLAAALGVVQSAIWNGSLGWAPASTMAEPPAVYFEVGRPFLLVYALLALAVAAHPTLEVKRMSLALLTVAALGDFGAYWLSDAIGPGFRKHAFWDVEVPALGALIGLWSVRGLRGEGRWLAGALPFAVIATMLLRYMPHGPVFGLALSLWSRGRAPLRRTAIGVAIFAVFALTLRLVVPYRANALAGPAVAGVAPIGRCELRLHVFNTGVNRMSRLLAPPPRPWRPVPAFVVEHPRGVVAFDTGLSLQVAALGKDALPWPMGWLLQSRGEPTRVFDVQLREAGLEPSAVVLSHQHADHTGVMLPVAQVTPRFEHDGPAPFERHHDLFGDGCVQLIPGGGHTPEDVMMLLAMPQGPVLLTGDAVVHFDWLASDDVERIAHDPERAATVRNQVRMFAREGVVIPGHDLSRLPRQLDDLVVHHPEWFEAAAWKVEP